MKIYHYLAGFLLALSSSCSDQAESGFPTEMKPGGVYFEIDGSASMADIVRTRAEEGGEIQTAEEKKVNKLLAVVFTDKKEDVNEEVFVKAVDIDLAGLEENLQNLSFSVGEEGNFTAAFIANADKTTEGKIKALQKGESTVKDFKAIHVESPLPETKPDEAKSDETKQGMLMNSDYYTFRTSLTQPTSLGTVYLTRVMARIDLINRIDGLTVTKVEFFNRTVQTLLYNDNGLQVNPAYLDDSNPEVYDGINLPGSKNPTATNCYKAHIYSYEQLAKKEQSSYLPSLKVYYTKDDAPVEEPYIVDFQIPISEDDPDGERTPIGLKRNYCYRIHLRSDNGEFQYEIVVADWTKEEDLNIGDDGLIDGALGDPADVGGNNVKDWENGGEEEPTEVPATPQ